MNLNYLVEVRPAYPKSNQKWPSQNYTSIKAWNFWNNKVSKVFKLQNNDTLGPYLQLKEWLTPVSEHTLSRQWYYVPSQQEFIEHMLI